MAKKTDVKYADILKIAGITNNGQVLPLKKTGFYRVCKRIYFYDPKRGRTCYKRTLHGYVVGDKFYTPSQFHDLYNNLGNLRNTRHPPKNDAAATPEEIAKSVAPATGILQRLAGPVPILWATAKRIGLIDFLKRSFGEGLALEMLSIAMCWLILRDNTARRYPRFCQQYALPFLGLMTEQDLADCFVSLGNSDAQRAELFEQLISTVDKSDYLSYDSTTVKSSAENNPFSFYAPTKEGGMELVFHYAVLYAQKARCPVAFRILPGNIPDIVTVADLFNRIDATSLEPELKDKLKYVLDRGYASLKNIIEATQRGKKILMAARDCKEKWVAEAIELAKERFNMWEASTLLPGLKGLHGATVEVDVPFPKALCVEGAENTQHVFVHVFHSVEQEGRETQKFCSTLDEIEATWKSASEDDRRKILEDKRVEEFYKTPKHGIKTKNLERDPAVIDEESKNFGFFADLTNYKCTASEAYLDYKERDSIEKCFKGGKSDLNLNITRAHEFDSLQGRMLISFVGLCIMSELHKQLGLRREFNDRRRKPLEANTFTVKDLLDITRAITINYSPVNQKWWYSELTEETRKLLLACGCEDAYTEAPEYIGNMLDLQKSASYK